MAELSFPASPSAGTRYVNSNGRMYTYSGYSWASDGKNINPNPWNNTFLYRTIYTRGYMHCGYQSSTLWRNTNRTVHVTDTTVNLGDMMDYVANYIDGGFSDYNTYAFNMSGAFQGSSVITSSMSMITETLRSRTSTWDLKTSRQNLKTLMSPGLTALYITGGGSATTDKFSTITDSMLAAGSVGSSGVVGNSGYANGLTGFFGQYKGIVACFGDSSSLDFSTETWTTGVLSAFTGNSGQPKGLSSKRGVGYCSTGGYEGSATFYKFNDTTGAQISTMARPENCGEENCQIGQDWGYTLGSYNGAAQTNNSTKTSYLTDSCVALGSDGQPKGHGGASSGCCATGSSTLLGGVMGTSI